MNLTTTTGETLAVNWARVDYVYTETTDDGFCTAICWTGDPDHVVRVQQPFEQVAAEMRYHLGNLAATLAKASRTSGRNS